MDLSQIASDALNTITPYLIQKGKAITEGIENELWEIIKKPFTSDKDRSLITQFEDQPSDAKIQGKIELKLEELLEAHPEIAKELESLVSQPLMPRRYHLTTSTITGDSNVTTQETHRSTININQR